MKITDMVKKRKEQVLVNVKVDKDLYEQLKTKFKKEKVTLHDFFVAVANAYLQE